MSIIKNYSLFLEKINNLSYLDLVMIKNNQTIDLLLKDNIKLNLTKLWSGILEEFGDNSLHFFKINTTTKPEIFLENIVKNKDYFIHNDNYPNFLMIEGNDFDSDNTKNTKADNIKFHFYENVDNFYFTDFISVSKNQIDGKYKENKIKNVKVISHSLKDSEITMSEINIFGLSGKNIIAKYDKNREILKYKISGNYVNVILLKYIKDENSKIIKAILKYKKDNEIFRKTIRKTEAQILADNNISEYGTIILKDPNASKKYKNFYFKFELKHDNPEDKNLTWFDKSNKTSYEIISLELNVNNENEEYFKFEISNGDIINMSPELTVEIKQNGFNEFGLEKKNNKIEKSEEKIESKEKETVDEIETKKSVKEPDNSKNVTKSYVNVKPNILYQMISKDPKTSFKISDIISYNIDKDLINSNNEYAIKFSFNHEGIANTMITTVSFNNDKTKYKLNIKKIDHKIEIKKEGKSFSIENGKVLNLHMIDLKLDNENITFNISFNPSITFNNLKIESIDTINNLIPKINEGFFSNAVDNVKGLFMRGDKSVKDKIKDVAIDLKLKTVQDIKNAIGLNPKKSFNPENWNDKTTITIQYNNTDILMLKKQMSFANNKTIWSLLHTTDKEVLDEFKFENINPKDMLLGFTDGEIKEKEKFYASLLKRHLTGILHFNQYGITK